MSISVIVELPAEPGIRQTMVEGHGSGQLGFRGSARSVVLDDPDTLIEIADRESAEARAAHLETVAGGTHAPPIELSAAPFRATVVRQLP